MVNQSLLSSSNIYTLHEYERDASRLTLQYLSQQQNNAEIGIEIPQVIKESLYKALVAVHNSQDPNAIKVSALKIHTKAQPFYIDDFTVIHSNDAPWVTPLKKGVPQTSDATINELIKTYNLDINKYDKESKSFIISAYPHVNMNELAKQLSEIEGVAAVRIPELQKPDHDILAEYEKNRWIITYEKEYFNKGYKIQWSFSVDTEGNVTFLDKLKSE